MAIDPVTGAAIISGGTKLISSLFGRKSAQKANKTRMKIAREANEAQMELAKYGFERDKEMWEMEQAYNAPKAQMGRLKEAGLNPNLVYGSGVPGGVTAGPAPSFDVPNIQRANIDTPPPIDPGGAAQAGLAAYSDATGIQQQEQQLDKGEIDIGIRKMDRTIRNLEYGSQKLDHALSQAKFESLFGKTDMLWGINSENFNETVGRLREDFANQFSESERIKVGRELANDYQEEVNKMLISDGITPGDNAYIRIGRMILKAMGYDVSEMLTK